MESKRLSILEKALKVIKETLEKTRRGIRNPSRRPITPNRPRPSRIPKRGNVRHRKVISANRGITSFWRNEDGGENIEYSENGQWKMNKVGPFLAAAAGSIAGKVVADKVLDKEEDNMVHSGKYHIHVDGSPITTEPITLEQVNNRYGSAQRLESKGYRLIPHKIKKD